MKRKDLGLIVIIVVIAAIMSLVISNKLFGSGESKEVKAPVVQAITSDFETPSTKYFNSNSFDPTKTITIGQNANPDPFAGSSTSQ